MSPSPCSYSHEGIIPPSSKSADFLYGKRPHKRMARFQIPIHSLLAGRKQIEYEKTLPMITSIQDGGQSDYGDSLSEQHCSVVLFPFNFGRDRRLEARLEYDKPGVSSPKGAGQGLAKQKSTNSCYCKAADS